MSASIGTMAESTLTLTRIFDAPRALVFRAWTDPALAAHWWAPRGFTLISCEMQVRPGGAWRRCMRSPDGSVICKRGVYREIAAPERLVFTYADEDEAGVPGHETLVTVTFAESGGKTVLTLQHGRFETATTRDAHNAGWAGALDRLAGHLDIEDESE
jgi:uncharacterized protein YndB with AHSA1/START domain